jgi:elongation factor P
MISTKRFKNRCHRRNYGAVWAVLEFQHVKPGKGAAFVRTKMKNVATGAVQERTFNAGEKLNKARVENKEMQFLYVSGDFYTFMDNKHL